MIFSGTMWFNNMRDPCWPNAGQSRYQDASVCKGALRCSAVRFFCFFLVKGSGKCVQQVKSPQPRQRWWRWGNRWRTERWIVIHCLPSLRPCFQRGKQKLNRGTSSLLAVLLRIHCQHRRLRVQSAAADPVPARQTHTVLVISGTTAESDD